MLLKFRAEAEAETRGY